MHCTFAYTAYTFALEFFGKWANLVTGDKLFWFQMGLQPTFFKQFGYCCKCAKPLHHLEQSCVLDFIRFSQLYIYFAYSLKAFLPCFLPYLRFAQNFACTQRGLHKQIRSLKSINCVKPNIFVFKCVQCLVERFATFNIPNILEASEVVFI